MDWNDFVQRLTRELMHLPANAFVIVQGRDGFPYVQAMRYLNGLDAEAVSNAYLPAPLEAGQEKQMAALGWHAPDGQARHNWWQRVLIPAEIDQITPEQATECGDLAGRMVAAFRDVYGVASPADLSYQANRNGEDAGPINLPGLGIPPVDAPLTTPTTWTDFTEQLAAELHGLDPDMVLVIPHEAQGSYYVQAYRTTGVRAEAVSGRALPPQLRFDARAEETLADTGWHPPGRNTNWIYDLPPDAPAAGYRRLAAMMVTALRDVQKAQSPADLVYEAFRGTSFIELTDFGIRPGDPSRINERRPRRPLPADDPTPPEPEAPARPERAETPPADEAPTQAVPLPPEPADTPPPMPAWDQHTSAPPPPSHAPPAHEPSPAVPSPPPDRIQAPPAEHAPAAPEPPPHEPAPRGKQPAAPAPPPYEPAPWEQEPANHTSPPYESAPGEPEQGRRHAPPPYGPAPEEQQAATQAPPPAEATPRPYEPTPTDHAAASHASPPDERAPGEWDAATSAPPPAGATPRPYEPTPADHAAANHAPPYVPTPQDQQAAAPPPPDRTETPPPDRPPPSHAPPPYEPAAGERDAATQAPPPAEATPRPYEPTPTDHAPPPYGPTPQDQQGAAPPPVDRMETPPSDRPPPSYAPPPYERAPGEQEAATPAPPPYGPAPRQPDAAASPPPPEAPPRPYEPTPTDHAPPPYGPTPQDRQGAAPPPVDRMGTPPSDRPPPSYAPPSYEPAAGERDVEAELTAAKGRGDQQGYLGLLLEADLYVPVRPGEAAGGPYATAVFNDGTYVLAFTSPDAMKRAAGGRPVEYRGTSLIELALEWPRPDWQLAVNARLESAAFIDTRTIERIAERERERARRQAEAEEPTAEVAVMQKVVRPDHVTHYLEGGYDWVAGYVHRSQDVVELATPEAVVRGLGLTYEGSPFSVDDAEIHVIRWPVYMSGLVRTPYGGLDEEGMRLMPDGWVIEKPPFLGTGYAPGDGPAIREFKVHSQRLPHGAEMYRIDRAGEETLVAVFDADTRKWGRV